MRTLRRRYWFWLAPEDPLAAVLDGLGPKERNAWIVSIVRAGLSPGGYREWVETMGRLVAAVNTPISPATTRDAPRPDLSELMNDAMSQFGFDE